MIKINRSRVPEPNILNIYNKSLTGEKNRVIHYVETEAKDLKDFKFTLYKKPEVKEALQNLFYEKCAYCESIFTQNSYGQIEHWRPKKGVTEKVEHKGYYWLASDWKNLLWACPICNSKGNKGNKFPIQPESIYALKSTDKLTIEQPLLINPCEDDPQQHIKYDKEGFIYSDTLMGKTSIDIYGLDRSNLTVERTKAATEIERYIQGILKSISDIVFFNEENDPNNIKVREKINQKKSDIDDTLKVLNERLVDGSEFLGMNIYLIDKYIKNNSENDIFTKIMKENLIFNFPVTS